MKLFYLFSSLFCIWVSLLTSCDPVDNRLKFLNQSRDSIVVEISNDSLDFSFNGPEYYKENIVFPDSSLNFWRMGSDHAIVDYINRGKSKHLFVVVFHIDTIEKYQKSMTLDTLFKKRKYIKLSSYSINTLTQNNWIISYKK